MAYEILYEIGKGLVGAAIGGIIAWEWKDRKQQSRREKEELEQWYEQGMMILSRGIQRSNQGKFGHGVNFELIHSDLDSIAEELYEHARASPEDVDSDIEEMLVKLSKNYSEVAALAGKESDLTPSQFFIRLVDLGLEGDVSKDVANVTDSVFGSPESILETLTTGDIPDNVDLAPPEGEPLSDEERVEVGSKLIVSLMEILDSLEGRSAKEIDEAMDLMGEVNDEFGGTDEFVRNMLAQNVQHMSDDDVERIMNRTFSVQVDILQNMSNSAYEILESEKENI